MEHMSKEEKIQFLKNASDEERLEYFKKMDQELEDFVMQKSKEAKERREKYPEEEQSIEEIIEELSTHPAFVKEIDYSKPLHPLVEALIDIKYNPEDAKDSATNYKEEGNRLYREKDYRLAVDNYTQGIKARCQEKLLNAVLYTNRALAQYHLRNLRSAINDCVIARKFVPEHTKAIYRGCVCTLELKKYEECLKWCDVGLALEPENDQIYSVRIKAEKLFKIDQRDRRKEWAKERKEQAAENHLLDVIQSRGVKLGWVPQFDAESRVNPLELTSLESHHPSGARVHQDDTGTLHWPVLFMYPEHSVTDFIQAFKETDRFMDHLLMMFGKAVDPPPWDEDRKYHPHTIEIYFEDKEEECMYQVRPDTTLLEVLKHDRYRVHAGTPAFILVVQDSRYREVFIQKNKIKT